MESATSQSNQLVFIKSSEAITDNNGIQNYVFSNPLRANRGNRILAELLEAELPISYYTFTSQNNTF